MIKTGHGFLIWTTIFRLLAIVMIAISALLIVTGSYSIMALGATSQSSTTPSGGNIMLEVTSQPQIHGVAGQIIKVEAKITNTGSSSAGGIAYISIVDLIGKVPIDLEDWSAEKGLYIPTIQPGQSLPLEWNIRLVKAGSYTVDILFNKDSDLSSPPVSSPKIFMDVQPKLNLNPENILPVAFGVPAVLLAALGSINYARGRRTGVYR